MGKNLLWTDARYNARRYNAHYIGAPPPKKREIQAIPTYMKDENSANIRNFVRNKTICRQRSFRGPYTKKISVVIPSLNSGRYIERSILSILNQNWPDTEIIVIDGGSSDETCGILRKYDTRLAYRTSEPDRGQSHALNRGFQRATGDYYCWLNADDVFLPGAFQKIFQAFENHPRITVCYGNWYSIDEKHMIVDKTYALRARTPHFVYENMNSYNQAMFWRKEVHRRFGKFDESLHRIMDNDMIIRFLLNEGPEKFYRLDSFLGAFRLHQKQKTNLAEIDSSQEVEEIYLEKKFNFPPAHSLRGRYLRFSYRLFQLYSGLKHGGLRYTLRKIRQGTRRRKSLL
ncbi:MAG TPA: glycosyltransferase [Thermodesulfobacteriaceae bacterium]|nr:glycosyltransferase [Thermodesulfobacteriaceae bacterium]